MPNPLDVYNTYVKSLELTDNLDHLSEEAAKVTVSALKYTRAQGRGYLTTHSESERLEDLLSDIADLQGALDRVLNSMVEQGVVTGTREDLDARLSAIRNAEALRVSYKIMGVQP